MSAKGRCIKVVSEFLLPVVGEGYVDARDAHDKFEELVKAASALGFIWHKSKITTNRGRGYWWVTK